MGGGVGLSRDWIVTQQFFIGLCGAKVGKTILVCLRENNEITISIDA